MPAVDTIKIICDHSTSMEPQYLSSKYFVFGPSAVFSVVGLKGFKL